jgi:hypothetical protein
MAPPCGSIPRNGVKTANSINSTIIAFINPTPAPPRWSIYFIGVLSTANLSVPFKAV